MSLAASSIGRRGRGNYWADTIVHLAGQKRLRDLDFGIGGLANLGNYGCAFGPALLPQLHGYWQRVDVDPFPPHFLIAASVSIDQRKNPSLCQNSGKLALFCQNLHASTITCMFPYWQRLGSAATSDHSVFVSPVF
jgi:hypothetical protein